MYTCQATLGRSHQDIIAHYEAFRKVNKLALCTASNHYKQRNLLQLTRLKFYLKSSKFVEVVQMLRKFTMRCHQMTQSNDDPQSDIDSFLLLKWYSNNVLLHFTSFLSRIPAASPQHLEFISETSLHVKRKLAKININIMLAVWPCTKKLELCVLCGCWDKKIAWQNFNVNNSVSHCCYNVSC